MRTVIVHLMLRSVTMAHVTHAQNVITVRMVLMAHVVRVELDFQQEKIKNVLVVSQTRRIAKLLILT